MTAHQTHMPLDVARCRPEAYHCHKAHNCARATDWPLLGPTQHLTVVDASLCLPAGECQMFIDWTTAPRAMEAA